MKWEYKSYIAKPNDDYTADLNLLGDGGWEIIHIFQESNSYIWFYLRRPKQ